MSCWIKLTYERNTYVVDLDRVAAFCYIPNGRIAFTLPGGSTSVVITQQTDPQTYQFLLGYVEKQTGIPFP